ncbi:DUF421 domain-containing protein [Brevibacillus ruminantium]|uniref:DUF421 domain-containing protein n=1 Tax=Brevibacillus ruminantium TaxID=2950604 RepID=A0ABY4WB70_9BACL|nr:DUF421 domain-containing protein [Brevibacillus ruminantium]USG64096.1 DUF421 domain-containing protein [Brevibacillus ruminantium]
MEDLTTAVMRTIFSFFFILVLLRLMGKRELGKLSVFDVVISIMLAEMAVMSIEQIDKKASLFYLPMLLICLMEITMSWIFLKSKKMRDVVEGSGDMIIEKGEIREDAMRRNRLNFDDLMVHLRKKNIKNIADVEFAMIEHTGEVSVFPKPSKLPVTREDLNLPDIPQEKGEIAYNGLPIPLILDGKVRPKALQKIGQNELWLKREIRKHGIKDIRDVSFCSLDERGNLYVDKKDKPPH